MNDEQQKLLLSLKSGSEEKWNLLFAKYYPIAGRLVRANLPSLDKQTIDLIAQDVMLALHKKIQDINDMEHLRFFISVVAHNKCVDYIRRNRLVTSPITNELPFIEDKVILTDEKIKALNTALANLKEQASTLIRLRYLECLSYREIAAKTGIQEA